MSSHHFVKEQQEPALLIIRTEGFSFESIAPLLEWVPTVLVAQDAVETVISWGVKIDVILAETEFQRLNLSLLEAQYPVKFMTVKSGQFLEDGFQYLIATKHSAVNVIGFDHLSVFGLEPQLDFLDIVIWDGPLRYFPVKNGKFKKWFPATSLQLHAPENTFIEMKRGGSTELALIKHATFVDVEEGLVEFSGKGVFWIGEMMEKD